MYLTKVVPISQKLRRQAGASSARNEIEITPEMIEAGVEAFAGHYPDSAADGDYAASAVRAIWAAMMNSCASRLKSSR
jgi:hypothetical protein